MKEFYGYFNSIEGDVREYVDKELAEIFKAGFTNGVENEQALRVESVPASMKVRVNAGRAIIEGFVYSLEEDGSEVMQLNINPAGSAGRIDTVVLRLNMDTRKVFLVVVDGEPASVPKPKEPTRQGNIYELVLAHLNIEPNKTEVTDIKDTRADEVLCGYITASGLKRSYVDLLEEKITSNKSASDTAIGELQASVGVNATNIKESEQRIASNKQSIQANTRAIEANTQAIANKTNRRWVGELSVWGWTENNYIWTQEVSCAGLTDDVVLIGDILNVNSGDINEIRAIFEGYNNVYRIESLAGKVKVYAINKPGIILQMQFVETARTN